nr:outer membrane exchange protein TraA family protein [Pyxidicoccus trucidator]
MLSVCLAGVAVAAKQPAVVISGLPVAPSPSEVGTGLCRASSESLAPNVDFPADDVNFIRDMNSFMETSRDRRSTSVLRIVFDQSNNATQGDPTDPTNPQPSYGDFENSVAGCGRGGCTFPQRQFAPLGARYRGYINVTPQWVGVPIHFGFYTDDGVAFVIYDRAANAHRVINLPPQRFFPTWRTTNSVTFQNPGLYPVEILYAQGGSAAALEFSTYAGTFTDFESEYVTPPVVKLNASGFALAPPELFFQTENGRPSFPEDIDRCEQCSREFANDPGNGGCDPFYYCNAAALCAPCNSALKCGDSCAPCGLSTPYCANINERTQCVQCTEDSQCANGRCDLTDNSCRGCNDDGDCPNGRCDMTDNVCRGCNDDGDCPDNGRCDTATNQCTGCNDDSDCPGSVCDVAASTCVECTTDDHCPGDQVCDPNANECNECNDDSQCPRGEICSSHQCTPCATDDSCAGNSCNCCPNGTQCAALTPGASPSCVECTTNSQCAPGQVCDALNGTCVDSVPECNTADACGPGCAKCPGERPFCLDGEVCVQCRNDMECSDGQFCLSGECTASTTDRHCGVRGTACEGDTPFCLSDGSVQGSACVGCRDDNDCGSGQCNPTTRTCDNAGACAVTCNQGLVCNGSTCVECFADAHCPCGGTCDVSTNSCSTSCEDSGDCLGVQYCSPDTQECERGRRKPGTKPQGGAFCCGTTADATPAGSTTVLVLLAAGLLLLRTQRRAR